MAILKKLPLIFLPLLLTSCYETFDPKIDSKPVLCLNSLITAGDPVYVEVSRSWVFTDVAGEKDHSVKDATVTLFANGEQVDTGYLPKEGDRIHIHAFSPTYGEADADVTVPCPSLISRLAFEPISSSITDDEYTTHGKQRMLQFSIMVEMDISDSPDASEYYILLPSAFSSKGTLSQGSLDLRDPIFTEYISTMEDILGYSRSDVIFFSDRQFSSHPHSVLFGFNGCQYRSSFPGHIPTGLECGIEFTLWTISKSYYNWLCYRWQTEDGMLVDFADMTLADSIWGYSNVSTGAGVVAARSRSSATLDLSTFISTEISETGN